MAKAAAATGTLQVAGVAGYEGSIGASDEAQRLGLITAFCRRLRAWPAAEDAREEPIVTAGGSAFFDVVTAKLTARPRAKVILRSGAYLTHDHGFYGTLSPASRGSAGAPVLRQPSSRGPRCCPVPSPAWRCSGGPPRRRLRPGPAGAIARHPAVRGRAGGPDSSPAQT